jgi:branched-chain amino acid transport system permease protein
VTLGFGEIVPYVFLNARPITEGPNGLPGLSAPSVGPLLGGLLGMGNGVFPTVGNPWPYYLTMIGIITISMIFIYRLQDSRLGRSWAAIREDELAASANGINTVTTKLLAFALGASTAGFAGVFMASKLTLVSPGLFNFDVSFTVLAMVVLGGMGNIWGVAVGAFIIFMIQSVLLRQLNLFFNNVQVPILSDIDFIQYQYLLYGVALVAMMLWRPEGLFPSRRRRRELHTEEDADFQEHGDALGAAPE